MTRRRKRHVATRQQRQHPLAHVDQVVDRERTRDCLEQNRAACISAGAQARFNREILRSAHQKLPAPIGTKPVTRNGQAVGISHRDHGAQSGVRARLQRIAVHRQRREQIADIAQPWRLLGLYRVASRQF